MKEVCVETLKQVLGKVLGEEVISLSYNQEELQGGTVGSVWLVSGEANIPNGDTLDFKVVLKVQGKWERHGDANSWRREYDLYSSGLEAYFFDDLKWPICYHYEMNQASDEFMLWLEYIDGVSGEDLTLDMYEQSAHALGRFQGMLWVQNPPEIENLSNLSGKDYIRNFYTNYRSWNVVYDYVRSEDCKIPKHLCDMLVSIDNNAESILDNVSKLPIVLAHRDFWVANIIWRDGVIYLIDWDTTGWGFLGEDIASLVADEADVENMTEIFERCVKAYYEGFSEFVNVSDIKNNYIKEIILMMYGYRLVEWYLDAEAEEDKSLQINTLQKIFEIKENF